MVRAKTLILTLIILFAIPTATSLSLDIRIAEVTSYDTVEIDYKEEVNHMQEINFTLENTGAIGCTYQAGAQFNTSEEEKIAWSDPYPLWSGDSQFIQIREVFENKTETVPTELFIEYCGKTESLENFEFQVNNAQSFDESEEIHAETLEADSTSANLEINQDSGYLVPKEEPSLWKTSSVEINNQQAQINYNPPIFREETIQYYILNEQGEAIGQTTVDLETSETLITTIRQNILWIILAISAILNVVLALKHKGILESVQIKSLN